MSTQAVSRTGSYLKTLGLLTIATLALAALWIGWQVNRLTGAVCALVVCFMLLEAIRAMAYAALRLFGLVGRCTHGIRGASDNPYLCDTCTESLHARVRNDFDSLCRRPESQQPQTATQQTPEAERLSIILSPGFLTQMDARAFELLVTKLYSLMGHSVVHTGISGDGGVDAYFRNSSGLLTILQCKRTKGSVGTPVLRDLYGTMHHSKASLAIVVTTGQISEQARLWAHNKPIEFVELNKLIQLLQEHFREEDVVAEYFTKPQLQERLCPKCGARLRSRRGRRGMFWGCSAYPRCRYAESR